MRRLTATTAATLLLALTACGNGDTETDTTPEPVETTETTQEPQADDTETAAQEPDPASEDEEVAELIEEENELVSEWISALEAGSEEEEAEAEARLDEIYDRLDEIWGIPESEDDLADEFYDLAVTELVLSEGGSVSEILGVGLGPTAYGESLTADVGEEVEVFDHMYSEASDGSMGTLTLHEIERPINPQQCLDELGYADEPQHGDFVALHITLDAAPEVSDVFSVTESDFYIIDENDTMLRNEIISYEAWVCADRLGTLQSAQPGTNTSGIVMLDTDVAEGSATLVYDNFDTEIRWEF